MNRVYGRQRRRCPAGAKGHASRHHAHRQPTARLIAGRRLRFVLVMSLVAHPVLATVLALWAGPYLNDAHGLGGVARGNALLVMATAMIVGSPCYGPLDRLFDTRKRIVVGARWRTSRCSASSP